MIIVLVKKSRSNPIPTTNIPTPDPLLSSLQNRINDIIGGKTTLNNLNQQLPIDGAAVAGSVYGGGAAGATSAGSSNLGGAAGAAGVVIFEY